MRELRFDLLVTDDALAGFAPQWAALHASDPRATPFQHPAWLVPWWRQFGTEELCAMAVFCREELLAFLPLYIYTEPGTGERKLMLLGVGTSDYLDGVYAADCLADDVIAALQWLARVRNWDVLSLVQLPGGSLLRPAIRSLGAEEGAAESCLKLSACGMADLPAKIRRNAMYYGNAARRRGALELSVADGSNCLRRFDELVQLHTERWEGRGEGGVLADARVLAWHRAALPLLEESGLLRLYVLTLTEKTIAAMYALADVPARRDRTAYFYLPGFSLAHRDLRPGTLLMGAAIADGASEGIRTIDLLRGNEEYKRRWHAEPVPTYGCGLARNKMMLPPTRWEIVA